MEMHEIIEQAEQNIRQALDDYGAHTSQTGVLYDVSDEFIHRLARDSSYAKQSLRDMFSKSPVWDEKIDALVINGTRTHNPNYGRIREMVNYILFDKIQDADIDTAELLAHAIDFFCNPQDERRNEIVEAVGIEAIMKLAPKAYAPGKKLSRVFRALCKELGVVDETVGSDFQRIFAKLADELTSKKIGFKLYVSINPAHFLTMSNPKVDSRGCTLTSCHSFNSTEYKYNNGCIGYARDEVSFIVFTVEDPSNTETLNNRKTTRQIFAYRPGNGLLMQSRMYNTSGGTRGAQEESKLYRDLVQREISLLEGAVNLWKTYPYCSEGRRDWVITDGSFGGYPDWTYPEFDGKVSLRVDHEYDFEPLIVGAAGLCICCADRNSNGLYCCDCDEDALVCDDCGRRCQETFTVNGSDGIERYVCYDCRECHYGRCDECGGYYPDDDDVFQYVDRQNICVHCLEEYYEECEECGEYFRREAMLSVVYDSSGASVWVCENCVANNYEVCPHCDEFIEVCEDGACPVCGARVEKENEEVESA